MKPCSDDLRSRAVAAMEAGGSCREVGGDRRSKLLDEADWIAARLAEVPDLALTDVRRDLAERGTQVSYSGVWRLVQRLGLRFKKNDIRERAKPA